MKKFKKLAVITSVVIMGSMAVTAMAATTTKVKTIGAQKAKEIALSHAKLKAADVKFEKAKLDYDDNVAVYEVDFYTNSTAYDYEINAASGKIIESEKESRKSGTQTNQGSQKPQSNITVDKVKSIVLEHAKLQGQNVAFEKVELDRDGHTSVYDVAFHHNGTEYDYEVDATNGAILEFEADNN